MWIVAIKSWACDRLRPILSFAPAVLGILLAGCQSAPPDPQLEWWPYEGRQQAWPTNAAALMHSIDGFPIFAFDQFPAVPYDVLGSLRAFSRDAATDPYETDRVVARRARSEGGHAALLSRTNLYAVPRQAGERDYVIIQFKTNSLNAAMERIDVFLALTAGSSNGYSGPDFQGTVVHYSAQELAAQRAELEKLREMIQSVLRKR